MELLGELLLVVVLAIGGISVSVHHAPFFLMLLDEDEADDN
jgi:hypothetical protein